MIPDTSTNPNYDYPQDYIGRIDENMLRVIVNLETSTNSTGTGFLVNKGKQIFLVTNKHMIGQYSLVDPFILDNSVSVYFYPETPHTSIRKVIPLKDSKGNPTKEVRLHPSEDVDIAVIDVTSIFDANKDIARNSVGTGFLIPIKDTSKEIFLGFGSQVFAIGYPTGFKLSTSNYPIAKSNFIASSLSGNLEIMTSWKNRSSVQVSKTLTKKFYLVDGLIVGGNSGGPIISPKDFYYKVNEKHELQSVNYKVANLIIGIVSFGWPGTGLTVIYPCDYILELL
ncbi:serine protease [Flavobacterium sp.]|uniref:S1 family peptidase n=1 Tax=Flavobacterium sp. TaxID=239 RepID=UPI003752FC15